MKLTFLGGADEVGASSTLIEIGGKHVLVDAGIRISPRSNRGIQNDQLPDLRPISDMGGLDYILVTHAHTDHTGALPLIVEQYPHVPVLATKPTVELVRILQADAQRIMRSRQEQEGELPLFDEIAAERLMNAFQPVDFRQPVRLGDGLQVTYHQAGHIVGAAMLVLESAEGILVMSGDLSLTVQRAVANALLPNIKADALVLESTYGGKLHANRVAEEKRLIDTLRKITERGGKALIPAFALGRAQEVLQILLAYRDQLDVPVYADGMVRSVCRAYSTFPDWLPAATTKQAGNEPLFFRSKIKSVDTAIQRDAVIHSEEPAVIVASSGMLTGGASVIYAKELAGDARNAILLTGYQDEEAPGRFLQRLAQRQQPGEEAVLRIEGQAIPLRCEIGTYSLSAHADEAELVSVGEALGAEEIMLVHGDPGARHSLATNLRQRTKHVQTPRIGQTISFTFAARPWALGKVKTGAESRPLDAAELWNALKDNAGNFYSASELARMWWGEPGRAEEVISTLTTDELYFAADWRRRDTFRVKTPDQIAKTQRQRAIMLAQPDIVGKLVVLRDSNNRPRVGIVTNASAEAFEARVHNAKGQHYPADALLWVIAPWGDFPIDEVSPADATQMLTQDDADQSTPVGDEGNLPQTVKTGTGRQRLSAVVQQANTLQDTLLPLAKRQQLVNQGVPVIPDDLLPAALPEGVTREVALLALVLALARDGAILEPNGLLPQRAAQGEPLEMNQARQVAMAAFPPEAQMRKVGMEVHRRRMTLTFDFPEIAARQYAELIEQVADQTGWEVMLNPQVNQLALGIAVQEMLPDSVRILKGPSFHLDRREVHVEVEGSGDLTAIERAYGARTGFGLRLLRRGEPVPVENHPRAVAPSGKQMEINAAYGLIRQVLEPHGLYKTSLKQGQIVLSFISPQVGERCQEIIDQLTQQTGYVLTIHPHPNQQQILQIAQQVMREAGWQIRKGPGIHIDRAEVAVTLANDADTAEIEAVSQNFETQTGYRLVLN